MGMGSCKDFYIRVLVMSTGSIIETLRCWIELTIVHEVILGGMKGKILRHRRGFCSILGYFLFD